MRSLISSRVMFRRPPRAQQFVRTSGGVDWRQRGGGANVQILKVCGFAFEEAGRSTVLLAVRSLQRNSAAARAGNCMAHQFLRPQKRGADVVYGLDVRRRLAFDGATQHWILADILSAGNVA